LASEVFSTTGQTWKAIRVKYAIIIFPMYGEMEADRVLHETVARILADVFSQLAGFLSTYAGIDGGRPTRVGFRFEEGGNPCPAEELFAM
jgi:hypothetical protein